MSDSLTPGIEDKAKAIEVIRKRRGAELRALIVSWDEGKPFDQVLRDQQAQIDAGIFSPSEEWCVAADEILGFYMSRPRLTAWDQKETPDRNEGPRIVIP